MTLTVDSVAPTAIRFAATSDDSYIIHWMTWDAALVEWESVSETHTRVRWTLTYRRRLDPAWYFAPLERFAVKIAAGYLIETAATPAEPPVP